MSGARHEVIVHQAGRLHVRVANGGTDKFESALLEVPAQRVRLSGCGRHVAHGLPPIDDRCPVHKSPHVVVERAELALHALTRQRIGNRADDLAAVSNDAGILHQPLHIGVRKTRDRVDVPVGKSARVVLATRENR